MSLRNGTAALVVLAATALWAQSASPVTGTPANRKPMPSHKVVSPFGANPATAEQNPLAMRQKMLAMEGTLRQMHAVAQTMHTKAASSSKDSLAKENVEMWDLLLSHLDNQFEELKAAASARDEFEARRAALYKQAEAKASAAAEAAKNAPASQQPAPETPAPAAGSNSPN